MHNLSGWILAGALALGTTEATAALVPNDGLSWHTPHDGTSHPFLKIRLRLYDTKPGKERPLQVTEGICRDRMTK
jgi:hypothetical protein